MLHARNYYIDSFYRILLIIGDLEEYFLHWINLFIPDGLAQLSVSDIMIFQYRHRQYHCNININIFRIVVEAMLVT